MAMVDIVNVVNVSVLTPPAGVSAYNINNLACFTRETPAVALTGAYAVYSSAAAVATQWGSSSKVYLAAAAIFAQSPNILTGGGLFIVVPMLGASETLDEAMIRASALIYFGGCSYGYDLAPAGSGASGPGGVTGIAEVLTAATTAETLGKLLFITSAVEADLQSSGTFDTIVDSTLPHARCLYHGATGQLDGFRWGYASRAMSTNFNAENVASTMHLKALSGVTKDTAMTQTILTECQTVGADVYVEIAGQSCVMSNGANSFYDDVYNLDWIIGALEVAGFNFLRTTATKIPQTEQGMNGLKGAYRRVCQQAVKNGFLAPGAWTGSDTFGNPEDFRRNIEDFGYYIYSGPIADQATADREDRIAPVVQIALKYAGAVHSTSVIVNINK
jgi:hypothetical protein